jgi:putative membrane protein
VAAELLPGVSVSGPGPLLLAGLVFGLVNTFVKPVLLVLTLPVTVLTLGLFLLVLNGLMLLLVAWLVPGFGVGSFWQAVGAALLVSILGFVLNLIRRR